MVNRCEKKTGEKNGRKITRGWSSWGSCIMYCTVCIWLVSGILKNLAENHESKLTRAEISHVFENNFLKSKSEENAENDMWSP